MHDVSSDWYQIFLEVGHQKEIKVTINGVEYLPEDDRLIRASISGRLFDAPSVGGAVSRTLELEIVPWDGTRGKIPPMSEIRLFVRLVSADGTRKSDEYIPKGVFYSDTAKRDRDTGAVTVTAFDAMLKMELPFGVGVCRITFDDLLGGIQRYIREIGDAMPTPDTPTHTGERFAAWSPNPSDTPTVVHDMLFTAQWEQKYTVTFDSGDGTPQVFACFEGDATPTPATPTKAGYAFMGWTPTPTPTVTADATYTAQWMVSEYEITPPTKTAYLTGEPLDYTGLSVTHYLSDGTSEDITSLCTFVPAAMTLVTQEGDITVSVKSNGATLGTFQLSVSAAEVIASGDYWTLYESGFLEIYCVGDMPNYNSSGPNAAPWNNRAVPVKSVIIEDSVTSIGQYAFYSCSSLISVEIPDSVTSIGYWPFGYCSSLTSVTIPDSVTSVGEGAFRDCSSLTSVTIGASVTTIGEGAFRGCSSLTSVTIGDSVTTIGASAFHGCSSLTSVTIPDSVTTIDYGAFGSCRNLTSVTIPDSVTTIAYGAFNSCSNLTSVTIPDNVTSIGSWTFRDCSSLTSVTIGASVTTIGESAFRGCSSLSSVTVPDNVTTIGEGAFRSCSSLASVTIGDSVTTIGESAFGDCSSLTSVTIGVSLSTIKGYAFYGCNRLTDVYYGGSQAQWKAINDWGGNFPLTSATIHYDSSGPT